MKKLILFISLISFFSCQKEKNTAQKNPQLDKIISEYYEDQLKLSPLSATFNGDNRYNDLLNIDFTDSHRALVKSTLEKYQKSIQEIDRESLNTNDQLTYDLIERDVNLGMEGLSFPENFIPLNQFYGFHLTFAQLGSGSVIQPFVTTKDYENWSKRMLKGAAYLDSSIVYFRKGMAAGHVLPKALIVKIIPQLEAFNVKDVKESTFYGPIKNLPKSFSEADKKRFTELYVNNIQQIILPAYSRLATFIKEEYLPKGRLSSGISDIPNGKAYYQYLIRTMTTTDKSADEIYQTGLSEVKRIKTEMEKTKDAVGFKGELKAFFEHMRTDPKFTPFKDPAEVLAAFETIHKKMEPQLKTMFGRVPKSPFEIRQTEAFRAASASAEYFAGTEDGKRPGIFYVPITNAKTFNLTSGMESLFLHEAIPGHHYQISLQQENGDLPKFRRFGGNSAYAEGWALYTESLGKELGLYTDPYQYMGALGDEMHRAIRLVVDAGMHSKNMTREEAIKFMMDNEPLNEEGTIAEIERYMAIPAQALSYKIGALKIKEIRERLTKQLGTKFKLSDFHDELLKDGNMPLEVLEKKMDQWANGLK
ncbi:MAG: DUF885 domain-containing protein [Cytophagales bacterium]|nr:DUF885 domain-containing protein [Cytophagales bacterium]